MPRKSCEREVDQSLAKIVGIPGSREKPVFDQTGSESQGVIFLCIPNKVQKTAHCVATNYKSEYAGLKRYMTA